MPGATYVSTAAWMIGCLVGEQRNRVEHDSSPVLKLCFA